tara:strand:- start:2911 stop:3201 length:291 start_codon:yes stop_codon:yes gene_type:complete
MIKDNQPLPEKRLFDLKNMKGIHARVAAKIVQTAEPFDVEATISYRNMTVPLLSIMGLLMLSARKDARVEIHAQGPQAQELFQALHDLFDRKFDEE